MNRENKGICVFATKSDFLIPITLQPNVRSEIFYFVNSVSSNDLSL